MTNQLQTIQHKYFGAVRILIADNEKWFVIQDLVNSNCSHATIRYQTRYNCKTFKTYEKDSKIQKRICVNEDGLNHILKYSKDMEAKHLFKQRRTNINMLSNKHLDERILKTFAHNDFGVVRVVIKNQKIWFSLVDICDGFHISNPQYIRATFYSSQVTTLHIKKWRDISTFIDLSALNSLMTPARQKLPFYRWMRCYVFPDLPIKIKNANIAT